MTVIRIPKKQLRKGMYIESVECPQFMFDKRRFVLEQEADLRAIWAAKGDYVVVNTAKGRLAGMDALFAGLETDQVRQRVSETVIRSLHALKDGFADFMTGDGKSIDAFKPVAKDITGIMAGAPAIFTELTRLKSKDEGTFMHCLAVAGLMSGLGLSLGLEKDTVETLSIAGMVHDSGKLLIPSSIINKPGALTVAERHLIRTHPTLGYQRLASYPDMPEIILDVCYNHHEMLDGSGYPRGLEDKDISLHARIATVCDVYDALTSSRPYKKGWTGHEAISWMFEKDKLFDRRLLVRLGEITTGN